MDAVTYPDEKITVFVQKNFIPLQVAHDAKPLSGDFNIKWTPTIIILGIDGREHNRTVGFLNPDDFIASGLLGLGKFHFDNDRYQEAIDLFTNLLSSHPASDYVPEAIFLRCVARYKQSGERRFLKDAYEILSSQHPDSAWAKKAYPYRLL